MSFNALLLLVFLQFGRPQDFFPFLKPFRLALLLSFIALALSLVSKSDTISWEIFSVTEGKRYFLFFLIMIVGVPFAYHRGYAFNYVLFKYLANVIFFVLFFVNVGSISQLKTVLFIVCVSVLFQASMSLAQGSFLYGRFYPGTMFDPNDLAFFLVSFLPLFFLFIRKSQLLIKRMLAVAGFFLSLGVILLTGSRGGLLGLITVILFVLFTKTLIEKLSIKILLGLFIAFAVFFNSDRINIDRLHSVTDLSSDYNVSSETGRLSVWGRGLSLAISNPISGVGVTCFNRAIGGHRADDGEIPRWQSPHNSYVQVVTEVGVIGFFIFMSLIIVCLLNFHRLSKVKFSVDGLPDYYAGIPAVCKVGLTGALVGAFFLTQAYSSIFTFYFAMSAILRRLSGE